MYKVILHAQAREFFGDADRQVARKLAHGFEILEQTPRHHPNIKPLSGPLIGQHRLRVGDYRIVYLIDDPAGVVHVLKIAHRSEAYR